MTRVCHLVLVGLIACGGASTSTPPPVVGNQVEAPATPAPPPQPCESIHAILRDRRTNEVMIGATVVGQGPELQGEVVAMSDEKGYFSLQKGITLLTIYYLDYTIEQRVLPGRCDLGTLELDPP